MIRDSHLFTAAAAAFLIAASAASPALAQKQAAKPTLVETYGDWGAYATRGGKNKTCYALTQPKDRAPDTLKRDPAFIFVSDRPGEGVNDEVSIIVGFDVKPDSKPTAEISDTEFELVAKGSNLWIKNPAEEPKLVEAMRKGARMTVKAVSTRGNLTTDTYSLTGVTQALERVEKECN